MKQRRLRSSSIRREAEAPDRLLTMRDLAALFGVSLWTIRNWRRMGHGPREIRLGPASQRRSRQVRYRLEDVAAYLERQVEGPRPAKRRRSK